MLGLGLLLLPTAVVGCEDDESGVPTGPVPFDLFLEQTFQATCTYLARCSWLPDSASCNGALQLDRELFQLVADVKAGFVTYNQDAARLFINALSTKKCQFTIGAEREVELLFQSVFTGSIDGGGACLVDDECAGDAVCDRALCEGTGDWCCAGVCAPKPPGVPVGGDCSMLPCTDDAYCGQDEAGAAVCKDRPGNGEDCEGDFTCEDGLGCDPSGGKCYRLSRSGEECNPALATACLDYNNWCSTESETCVPLPRAGEACGTNGNLCALYAFCDGANQCVSRALQGEPCGGSEDCIGDLECRDGACTPRDPPDTCETMNPPEQPAP